MLSEVQRTALAGAPSRIVIHVLATDGVTLLASFKIAKTHTPPVGGGSTADTASRSSHVLASAGGSEWRCDAGKKCCGRCTSLSEYKVAVSGGDATASVSKSGM